MILSEYLLQPALFETIFPVLCFNAWSERAFRDDVSYPLKARTFSWNAD